MSLHYPAAALVSRRLTGRLSSSSSSSSSFQGIKSRQQMRRTLIQRSSWIRPNRTTNSTTNIAPSSSPFSSQPLRCVTEQDIQILRGFASVQSVSGGGGDNHRLLTDWTRQYPNAHDSYIVQPDGTDAVSQILRYCHTERIGVIPVSGNTGLVGGSMPINSGGGGGGTSSMILLSLTKLNEIYGLQPRSGILHCQAGVVLETLQDYVKDRNFMLPIDLGAKGTCCIGGNVATNAGGQYYYRYGSLAANVLGCQVVTADGTILNVGSRDNLKDNTGYKLHQLLIGSEGTLGIITQVTLLCRPALPFKETALVACENFEQVLNISDRAKHLLGERLAAVEWMDRNIVSLVQATHSSMKMPISPPGGDDETTSLFPHYVLLETHSSQEGGKEAFEAFLVQAFEETLILDGVIAQDVGSRQHFWNIRESCNPSAAATGWTYKYDVSLPESAFEAFIDTMKHHLAEDKDDEHSEANRSNGSVTVTNWGHVLDGNLHFNVTTPGVFERSDHVKRRLEPFVFEEVLRRGGSISAEHGIGQAKVQYMTMVHDHATLSVMKHLKQLFDPHGIMNPGKVLPMHDR